MVIVSSILNHNPRSVNNNVKLKGIEMEFKQWRIIFNLPFKPRVKCINGQLVRPTYKELWVMYKSSDYVSRIINQINDGPISMGVALTILYNYVHKNQNYYQLSETIKKIIWKKWLVV